MRRPGSVSALEDLGRVRLSENFFMRDMLYSEIANHYGIPNIPDDPELAIAAGTRLCEDLLEPICAKLGRISIRSAFRSCAVNEAGIGKHNCARNEANYAAHIWDRRDAERPPCLLEIVDLHCLPLLVDQMTQCVVTKGAGAERFSQSLLCRAKSEKSANHCF